MDQILQKAEGTGCYLDDIFVTGKNDEDHFKYLSFVLKKDKVARRQRLDGDRDRAARARAEQVVHSGPRNKDFT